MGSQIMLSMGLHDQICPNWQVPNFNFESNVTLKLIYLLLSVGYWNQIVSDPKWSY